MNKEKLKRDIISLYGADSFDITSEAEFKLDTTISLHTKELKKKIEGKRKPKNKIGDYEFFTAEEKGYNQALDEILSELNHQ